MKKIQYINTHIDKLKVGDKIKQAYKHRTKLYVINSINQQYNNYTNQYEYKITIKSYWYSDLYKKWMYDLYDLVRYKEYDRDGLIAYGLNDTCLLDMYYFKLPKPIVSIEVMKKYYKNSDGENELNSFDKDSRQIVLVVKGTFDQYCKITDLFNRYFNHSDDINDNYLYHLTSGGCVDSDDENNIHEESYFISNEENWKNDTCMLKEFKKEFTKFKKSIKNLV